MNGNLDLMVKNVTQINDGVMICVDVSVKDMIYVKKIILGILLCENGKSSASIMDKGICEEKNFNEKNIN